MRCTKGYSSASNPAVEPVTSVSFGGGFRVCGRHWPHDSIFALARLREGRQILDVGL